MRRVQLPIMAARAVDEDYKNKRRIVSEAKRSLREAAWNGREPILCRSWVAWGILKSIRSSERSRDVRLSLIWTGTSQIMNMMIQHEYYDEDTQSALDRRPMEKEP